MKNPEHTHLYTDNRKSSGVVSIQIGFSSFFIHNIYLSIKKKIALNLKQINDSKKRKKRIQSE